MNVVRKMIILTGGDADQKGVLKLDKIGVKVSGVLNLYGAADGALYLFIKNGDDYVCPVRISAEKTEFDVDCGTLSSDIECAVYSNGKVILSGATGSASVGSAKLIDESEKRFGVLEKHRSVVEEVAKTIEEEKQISEELPETETAVAAQVPATDTVEAQDEPVIAENQPEEPAVYPWEQPAAPDLRGQFAFFGDADQKVQVSDVVKYTTEYPFYDAVRLQLEELFTLYPEEEALKTAIPESQWAHIKYDESEYYVVGLIKEDETPRYICYGVPANRKIMPECDITENCDWMCVNPEDQDEGYYMMYQDAITGETLEK